MARKTINAKEVIELEIKFNDGKSLLLKFDMEALSHLTGLEGGIKGFITEKSTSEMCAKQIYAGALYFNPNFTIDEARAIVANLSPATITEIMNEFNESVISESISVNGEAQKKILMELLSMLK